MEGFLLSRVQLKAGTLNINAELEEANSYVSPHTDQRLGRMTISFVANNEEECQLINDFTATKSPVETIVEGREPKKWRIGK